LFERDPELDPERDAERDLEAAFLAGAFFLFP
jgi:hypothetical protein